MRLKAHEHCCNKHADNMSCDCPKTPSERLSGFTDEEMRRELLARETERKRVTDEDRKRKTVRVECPWCKGSGGHNAYSSMDGMEVWSQCPCCKGNHSIEAVLR